MAYNCHLVAIVPMCKTSISISAAVSSNMAKILAIKINLEKSNAI